MPVSPRGPVIEVHHGIHVVRDDLHPGGTKARIFEYLYSRYDDVVYCCAATSCTQIALATAAKRLGKKATLFVAARAKETRQTAQAKILGADVRFVSPGYLSVCRARAKEYAAGRDSVMLASLGFNIPEIIDRIAGIAMQAAVVPDEVWCAAGSGVMTLALQRAWPTARHHAVQVGKDCDVGVAKKHTSSLKFEQEYKGATEFPSERHFDAKAWDLCKYNHTRGAKVLFWNVLGDL